MKTAKKKKDPLPDNPKHEETRDALRDSERKYQELVELLPQTVFEVDRNGNITFVNPVALDTFGFTEEEFKAGVNIFDVFAQQDHVRLVANIHKILSGEKLSGIEYTARKKDGSTIPVITYSVPVILADTPVGLRGVLINITDRKAAEDALRESRDLYQTLAESSPEMVYLIDRGGYIRYVNSLAARQFMKSPADLIGKHLDEVFPPDVAQQHLETITRTIETGQTQFSEIFESFPERGLWISARLSPVKDAAGVVTQVLGISVDITEQKMVEEALRESEEKYRRLAETTHDIIVTTDFDGIVTYANPAAQNLVGDNEVVGVSIKEFIHEDLIERHREMLNARRQGFSGTLRFEWKLKLPGDGSIVLLDVVSVVLLDKGVPSGILFNARDITDRKRAQEALRESEAALSSIFRAAPIGIGVVSNRILLQVNDQLCGMTGYSREDLVGKSARILYPDDEEFEKVGTEKYAQIREHGTGSVETRWQFRDGSIHNILLSSTPLDPTNPAAGVTFTAMDITDRKRAEEALRESEATARALLNAPTDSILLLDTKGVILDLNETAAVRMGKRKDELIGVLADKILSVDLARTRRSSVRKVFETKSSVRFEDERDGIWFDTVAYPITDERGAVNRIAIIARDVTDRHHIDEALRVSEEKYRVVAEMAKDGIAIVQGNKLVYINPSLANLVGYSVEEIIGKSFIPFLSPESVFDMLALMKKTLLGEPVPNFFLTRVMHRDGHKIEIEANGSAIIWEGKKALLGIIRDVTERNRVEEELRKYSEKLEEMVSERTEKLNKSLEEKEILLREVHHRVKNNLQIIISLLNLQSRYITDEKTLAAIRESQNRVKAMALVHEKLHQSTDISKINLDDYINFLANSLFRFYGMTGKGLKLTTDIQDIYLDINTTIPLGLITNELVSNSLKYAFPDGRKGGISIAIKRENHVLTVVFKDNGVGMPPDLDWCNAKSLGLRLVISLVEQLQGTIELHRAAGTTFTMVLQEKQ